MLLSLPFGGRNSMSKELSNKGFWEKYWDNEVRSASNFTFCEILDACVDFENVHSYLEIGGAPGSIMAYINKKYGIPVAAIDYVDKRYIDATMEKCGIADYQVFQEDFIKLDTMKLAEKYDMVASWGFIEHFDLDVCREIIAKQKSLVSDGGYLIIELPNLRRFNWFLYWVFNKELLKIHNLDVMDLSFLKGEIERDQAFETIYGNYYLTSFLNFNAQNEFFIKHKWIGWMVNLIQKLAKKLRIENLPNKCFSPYIVFIARKKGSAKKVVRLTKGELGKEADYDA